MSMPQDLMQMLLGGGGNSPPFAQGQGMLAPSIPASVTPQQPQMGPEESAAMAMFTPPKDENEVNEIHQGWKGWLENSKKKPGFFKAMAAFGAAMSRPGGMGKNFAQAAAAYTDILDQEDKNTKQEGLQKFGILQQARGLDRQAQGQAAQLELQKSAAKLDQGRFGLQQIESDENRSLMLENLGIKKRELALAEAQSRSSIQRDGIQNGLVEMQINKLKKDIDKAGFFETTPGEPIGSTFVKEKANALMKADPKIGPDVALNKAMQEYATQAAQFTPTGALTPKDEFKAKIELMKAGEAAQVPGMPSVDPATRAANASEMVNAAKGTSTPTTPPPELITLAKTLQTEGYTLSGHDPGTRTVFVEKNGKLEKRTY